MRTGSPRSRTLATHDGLPGTSAMWVNPRFSESLEAIPFHYSFAECMHALAGVCGGVAAPGRGVMDTGMPATPARRGEHTGRERSKAWMDHVRVGSLAFP